MPPTQEPHAQEPLAVGVAGIAGRVGRLLAAAIASDPGLRLSAGSVRPGSDWVGQALATFAGQPADGVATDDASALFSTSRVVIDFSTPPLAPVHASLAARHGTALVLGTTGLDAAQDQALAEAARVVPVVQAANFATGVVLAVAIARRMAAALDAASYDAEILELHHARKVDAPSGTALALGRAVASGRGTTLEEAGVESGRHGHTGARKAGSIGFAALRGGLVVGEHTVLFAGAAEHLALTHRSFDRGVYATGAVRAARWAVRQAPGRYGMEQVLGLDA